MNRSKSLEILGIIGDLAIESGSLAARKLSEICLAHHGGSTRAYSTLLRRMEARGLITLTHSDSSDPRDWIPQLTNAGKNERPSSSPSLAWNTPWDEQWRMLTFDLPAGASALRSRLRNWLQELRFGKLQGSVWINHRKLDKIKSSFAKLNIPAEGVVCIEGKFWDKGSDARYVEKAWPLSRSQEAYANYLNFLEKRNSPPPSLQSFQSWKSQEQALWEQALYLDPLLPSELWKRTRRGPNLALEAEKRRQEAIQAWRDTIPDWPESP